ncbi:hypothetical protein BIW11_14204 [Tropilaelaps mercedesae]|uniref:Uncharacterized protein n=1 Tax=Tropilaelaps mercedesae TaxID=418985 RepID=A0A1V9WYL7_9ACAR|nr:hypothetical protein BIW11_14204 [Tropilaelaps mercedesae]
MVDVPDAVLQLFRKTVNLLTRLTQRDDPILRYAAYVVFLIFSLHFIPKSIRRAYGYVQVYRRRLRVNTWRRGTGAVRDNERGAEDRHLPERTALNGGNSQQSYNNQQNHHQWESGEEPRDHMKLNQIKYKTVFTKSSIITPCAAGHGACASPQFPADVSSTGNSVLTI